MVRRPAAGAAALGPAVARRRRAPGHTWRTAPASPRQPGCAERFELFAAGRELCNAYTELNDPEEQRRRFAAQDSDREAGDEEVPPADEAFCQALEYGMPPTAGWGLGVDRMVMLLTQSTHIRVRAPRRNGRGCAAVRLRGARADAPARRRT